MPFEEVTIGPCRLIRADCLEVLPTLQIESIVTDPPYGIRHSTSHGASWQDTEIAGDTDTSARDTAIALCGDVPMAVFGTWKTQPIDSVRGVCVWDKGPAFGMGDLDFPWKPSWELVYVRGRGWIGTRDEGVLRGGVVVSWESRGRVHPHQKPVWLYRHFIDKLPPRICVCDPFMGSGSCGEASIESLREFIGIEIEPRYFDIACRRIERAWLEKRSELPFEKPPTEVQRPLFGEVST